MIVNAASYTRWMSKCLELAEAARTCGDAAVGCVIVRDGIEISEGIESVSADGDPTAHAETLAVRSACARLGTMDLAGCTLITNVEPCWMCAFVIRQTRISRVVFARQVDGVGAVTSNHPILTIDDVSGWIQPPEIVRL